MVYKSIMTQDDLAFDKQHIWHPYTSTTRPLPVYPVASAHGCELHLAGPLGFDLSEPHLRRAGLDYHDLAHVMARAVQEIWPDVKVTIGPVRDAGWFYDFDRAEPFTPEDLKALDKAMQRIINEGQTFVRREISDDDALVELAGEPYKCELIGLKGNAANAAEGAEAEVGGGELTIYDNVHRNGEVAWAYADTCNPMCPRTVAP